MLSKLAKAGRNGDTLVAHFSPREAGLLKAMGGAGSINPKTGLLEFFSEGDGPDGMGQDDAANAAAAAAAAAAGGGPGVNAADAAIAVAQQANSMSPGSIMGIDTSPAGLARTGVGMMMGPMSPSLAFGLAQGVGNVAHALGATNEGATAAQGAVGQGGPMGDAGQQGGGPGFDPDAPPPAEGAATAPPPVRTLRPPMPRNPGLLDIGPPNLAPYSVPLLYRGMLAR